LLREIIDDAERCARIVRSVLQFAKRESSEKWPLSLNNVAQRAQDLTRDYARRCGVRLELELSDDLPPVVGNRTELEQVFVNVVNNAIEASRAGQSVAMRTEPAADRARVYVRDHGRGMTGDEREHAFDPFFTTRAKGGGTGLGLSMAHATVTEHGGNISIETAPGRGTTVIIEFPLLLPSSKTGAP
jgi:signal transduction histidine kinase